MKVLGEEELGPWRDDACEMVNEMMPRHWNELVEMLAEIAKVKVPGKPPHMHAMVVALALHLLTEWAGHQVAKKAQELVLIHGVPPDTVQQMVEQCFDRFEKGFKGELS